MRSRMLKTHGWLLIGVLLAGCTASSSSTKPAPQSPVRLSERDRDCLALVMYWEARGEGQIGMQAVGSVVLNRVVHPQFPNSVCGVIYQGGRATTVPVFLVVRRQK